MTRVVPIIELLRLMIADPALYRRFQEDPAAVFVEFGIDRPEHFLGIRAVQCPRMPPVPPEGDAATSIADPYWKPWLLGGAAQMEKMGVVDTILKNTGPVPDRASMTDEQWEALVAQVKARIRAANAAMRRPG